MLEFFVLLFTALVNLLLGLFVYIKNPKSSTNRLFAVLTIIFVVWSFVNYISVNPVFFSQLTWIRLVLFCGGLLNLTVFLTFLAFPNYSLKIHYGKQVKLALLASLIILPLTLTPLVFSGITINGESVQPIPNFGIGLFLLQTLILIGASFTSLIRKYRHSRGITRDQLRLVLLAIIGTFTLIVLSNFLLVVLFNITAFVPFGPVFTLIFSITMTYAIIKHRLFDIKRAVARSVAYLLSLGFIGLIYGGAIFLLSSIFVADNKIDNIERASYIILALLSALLYATTKKFFDKLTNKIFYRDAYDPEEFLDELNAAIVGNIELGVLLRHSTKVIQKNLKSEHCFIEVLPTPTTSNKIIGVGSIELDKTETEYMMNSLSRSGKRILITDQLGSGDSKLKNLLSDKNIGIITRLVPNSDHPTEAIANLIIGTKKSGNVYDKQDVHVIEIISDELLIAIENALRFEEIQGFAAKLQAEVNTATSKLQRTNRKLRELDETKDEFISMASHQLRTPLTSVKGYMSMVLEGDAGKISKQQRELLNQAFVSSQRMVYLIADLLNVSRLKTGKFVIESTPTNLAEVIEGEIDQLRETAKSKNMEIEYKKPKDFPTLALDETKIRQVIMNFADNAIYYTPSGGNVKVELSEDKSNVYFKVTDNGLGVPRSDVPHLFTKFYRASNARKARPDGTGLGLFMAKKVIDSQGGNLLFESEENKGSMFGFCFEKKKHLVKKAS